MTTGSFWNVDDPTKPWGPMDPDDALNIPYDFGDFLADQGTTYASHSITPEAGLAATNVAVSGNGIVTIQITKAVGATLVQGQKYGVTVQVTCSDTQKISKTLYYKIKDK